jgi:acetyl esterase/lipase
MTRRNLLILPLVLAAIVIAQTARAESPYKQTEDVVFGDVDGVGLLMDVFTPTGASNGLAIVDVASGLFYSDRGKINDHKRAQMFDIFCSRGYTVFAVRPGSITKFSLAEMAANVKKAIVWVKGHADEYKIDPNRLGLTGASAGGHLASLVALTADDKTAVKAVGVFFPPTDFLDFHGIKIDENASDSQLAMVAKFVFPIGTKTGSTSEMIEKLKAISPVHNVTGKAPPFLIIHGDKDPLVPLRQSEKLLAALQSAGVPAELIIKEGGGHPWPTIHEEVKVIADWLDKQLAAK